MVTINDEAIEYLLANNEFPDSVRRAAAKVVVIMTQSWCHEWNDMRSYLSDFESQMIVFALEYDRHPWFDRIMEHKEEVLGNRLIPYLRYYRDGELITTTNWLPRSTFAALLDRKTPFRTII